MNNYIFQSSFFICYKAGKPLSHLRSQMTAPFVREQKSVNAQSFVVKRSLRLFEDIYNLTLIHHSSIISHQLFRKQHKQQPQTEWFALHCEQLCCSFTAGIARSLQAF